MALAQPSLRGVWAKVERADEHLQTLRSEFQAFLDTDPYGAAIEEHPKTGLYVLRSLVDRQPPLRLGVIFGDWLHNLRSALDHLVCRLVETHKKQSGRWNAFPIYTSEAEFIKNVEHRPRKDGRGPLEGLSKVSDAWALIKRAQPYQRGKNARSDPLYVLNYFSNADKHRLLTPTFAWPDPNDFVPLIHWNPLASLSEMRINPQAGELLKDRAVFATLRFSPTGPHPEVDVHGKLPLLIAFGDESGVGHYPPFPIIRDVVAKIVRDCEVFFLKRP